MNLIERTKYYNLSINYFILFSCLSGPYTNTDVIAERAPTPLTRNVMVQTDYRDSETQTDPYAPEFVTRPGSQPELLTLATLSYGKKKTWEMLDIILIYILLFKLIISFSSISRG